MAFIQRPLRKTRSVFGIFMDGFPVNPRFIQAIQRPATFCCQFGRRNPIWNDRPTFNRRIHSSSEWRREHIPSAYPTLHPARNLRLKTEKEAEEMLGYLHQPERELLFKVLRQHLKKTNGGDVVGDIRLEFEQKPITSEQIKLLFLCNSLPFVGFGILDNLIMILAGEYIDSTLGIILGLSTMAAAGFGNIISDIAGVGLAHYVEFAVAKFFGVRQPPLTAEQWDSPRARWTSNSARAFGLTVGCLIGMFPLLFYDESETQERKMQAKRHVVEP